MLSLKFKDLNAFWEGMSQELVKYPIATRSRGFWHMSLLATTVHCHTHRADQLFLEDIGYTKHKASHLIRTYINPEVFSAWLTRIRDRVIQCGEVSADSALLLKTSVKHTHGPCLLSITYRSREDQPTLSVFVRSMEFPRKSFADTMLVSSIAEIVKRYLDLPDQLEVIWYIGTARIESLPAKFYRIYKLPKPVVYTNEDFQKHVQRGWERWVTSTRQASFNKLIRMQKLYQDKVAGRITSESGVEVFIKRLESYIE